MKATFKRDVTPYEISKYLKEVEGVDFAPQRIYRDRKDGRLAAYRSETTGKWMVEIADATAYVDRVLTGPSKANPAW